MRSLTPDGLTDAGGKPLGSEVAAWVAGRAKTSGYWVNNHTGTGLILFANGVFKNGKPIELTFEELARRGAGHEHVVIPPQGF